MRRELKPKQRKAVPIPDDLRASLLEVWQSIEDSERDPDMRVDYDDAIQVGNVSGGRTGESRRPFEFTYYPPDDAERGRWFLALHPTEIEDVADGVLDALPMYCCTSTDCRCKFREADDHCFYCDYEANPDRGTFTATEARPRLAAMGVLGLSDTSNRAGVIALLGQPIETGGGVMIHGHKVHPWATFRIAAGEILVEFWSKSGRIKAVTF
jgi:hypothetical protein